MELNVFLEKIEQKTGKAPVKSGSGYLSCCPSHDDGNPSLSLSEGLDGKILLHCFSGCTVDNVCASLGLKISDLFVHANSDLKQLRKIVYSYQDEHCKELFRKIRIEPGFEGKAKSFYSEHTDKNGMVVKNLKDCRKVLYRLPDIMKAIASGTQIFLVEGEKDADKLISSGLMATCAPETMLWLDDFTATLKEANVVLLYDNDETGIKRKKLLCEKLHGNVKRLRVVDLPGIEYRESHGQDISDWLTLGHTTKELRNCCENPFLHPSKKQNPSHKSGGISGSNTPRARNALIPLPSLSGISDDLREKRSRKDSCRTWYCICCSSRRMFLEMESSKSAQSPIY